ncbi:MAG: ribosome biogenesis GTPase Der [Planctomycetaceae bacterium]|nr:ribosome biogenesis GTPase Der [Planctomycetaceae bacterium]
MQAHTNETRTPLRPGQLPRLAIVGRPNVGKSSLTNMIAERRVSIVDPTPGVTRDRVTTVVSLESADASAPPVMAELTDTGGYGVYTTAGRKIDEAGFDLSMLTKDIEKQIAAAVRSADLVLFVIDAQTGLTAQDREVARLLREGGLAALDDPHARRQAAGDGPRVLVIANKVDGPRWEMHALEAANLGFGEPLMVSAKNNYCRREFTGRLHEIVSDLSADAVRRGREAEAAGHPDDAPPRAALPEMKLAIVGKRNAGKSTLVNHLAGEERVIVSEIPGTTRDAVDVRFEMDGRAFVAIDTAGLRRKKSFQDRIEWFALDRLQLAVDRCDVALFLIDATVPISQVDEQVGKMLADSFRPVVIVVNKWDLVQGRFAGAGRKARRGERVTPEIYESYIRDQLRGLDYAPISFISGQQGLNVRETIDLAFDLMRQSQTRAGTGQLNRMLREIVTRQGPSSKIGTFAKIFFAAQVRTQPPTIVCVVNRPELFTPNYQRFLLNRFREQLPFPEVPIRLIIRARKPKSAGKAAEEFPDIEQIEQMEAAGQQPELLAAEDYFDEPVQPHRQSQNDAPAHGGRPVARVVSGLAEDDATEELSEEPDAEFADDLADDDEPLSDLHDEQGEDADEADESEAAKPSAPADQADHDDADDSDGDAGDDADTDLPEDQLLDIEDEDAVSFDDNGDEDGDDEKPAPRPAARRPRPAARPQPRARPPARSPRPSHLPSPPPEPRASPRRPSPPRAAGPPSWPSPASPASPASRASRASRPSPPRARPPHPASAPPANPPPASAPPQSGPRAAGAADIGPGLRPIARFAPRSETTPKNPAKPDL